MRRSALALLGLLALSLPAAAQTGLTTQDPPERLPFARFAVTPFLGVRVPYSSGRYVVFSESGSQFSVQEERGGASAVGLNLEARMRGSLSFIAGASYSGREQYILQIDQTFADPDGGDDVSTQRVQADGPAIWAAKAGVAYRLPDPNPDTRRFHPSAFISVAPAIVWVDWEEIDGVEEDLTRSSRHFALDVAADATSRIARSNFAVNLGLEGMVTFWDFDALRVRDETVFAGQFEEPVVVDYDYSASTILFLRLGVSYRF